LIRLSVPEVRKMLLQIVWSGIVEDDHAIRWSDWRRCHQYWAKHYHYKRRNDVMPKVDLQL